MTTDTSASCSGASGSAIDSCSRIAAVSSSNSSKNGAAVSSDRDSVYGGSTLILCPDRKKQNDYMTSSAASDFEKKVCA